MLIVVFMHLLHIIVQLSSSDFKHRSYRFILRKNTLLYACVLFQFDVFLVFDEQNAFRVGWHILTRVNIRTFIEFRIRVECDLALSHQVK